MSYSAASSDQPNVGLRRHGLLGALSSARNDGSLRPSIAEWLGMRLPGLYGAGAITAGLLFVGITCWWLTQDRSIPIYDAGDHLESAFEYHNMIRSGDLLGPFDRVTQYPPLVFLVGAFAVFVGGTNVATPVVAENLIFVPILILGCYQTGKLLFDARAGLLAVTFVLASPLLTEQFHVFMLDAPETSLVAISIWLLLASQSFRRKRIAVYAGVAVGCGFLVKVTFPIFIVGIPIVQLARGGWRNWRGVALFMLPVLLIGAPWYLIHLSDLGAIARYAGTASGAAPGNIPPLFSAANLEWYFWSTLNSELLAPLFALLLVGAGVMCVKVARRRDGSSGLHLALLTGCAIAWLGVTLTPHHDIRYDMPLMPYLAVIATGWTVYLPRPGRIALASTVVIVLIANTLASSFGDGTTMEVKLTSVPPATQAGPDRIVAYTNSGFLVDGPQWDGDVPTLLARLQRAGVTAVTWSIAQSEQPDFSFEGLLPLARIAKLKPLIEERLVFVKKPSIATLIHGTVGSIRAPACTRLSDGTAVWVARDNPHIGKIQLYCPSRHPDYYGT